LAGRKSGASSKRRPDAEEPMLERGRKYLRLVTQDNLSSYNMEVSLARWMLFRSPLIQNQIASSDIGMLSNKQFKFDKLLSGN
jgi:hypothetical protein